MDHYDDFSLIDYNRSGVPLVEIVTEPCMHSAKEAVSYLETLRNTFKYCDISQADTKMGQIRCDVNISLMEENKDGLGTKVEIKNINSFSNVAKAIEYEIERQTKLLENNQGNEIIQETRRYDDETDTTIRMRKKVESVDYKYFVEPNIPKFKIDKEYLADIRKEVPVLPYYRYKKYTQDYNLSELDAYTIIKDKKISDYYEACLDINIDPKTAANWVTGNILSVLNRKEIEITDFYLTPIMLKEILDKIEDKTISSKQAKEIFNKVIEEEKEPNNFINNMSQLSDEDQLREIIKNILNNNTSQVEAYKNGKDNLFKFFIGQVMKETKGKANPVVSNEILKEELSK